MELPFVRPCGLSSLSLTSLRIGSFYRAAIPGDVIEGTPVPSTWGPPSAILGPAKCNISNFFHNHTIVFGASYIIFIVLHLPTPI